MAPNRTGFALLSQLQSRQIAPGGASHSTSHTGLSTSGWGEPMKRDASIELVLTTSTLVARVPLP